VTNGIGGAQIFLISVRQHRSGTRATRLDIPFLRFEALAARLPCASFCLVKPVSGEVFFSPRKPHFPVRSFLNLGVVRILRSQTPWPPRGAQAPRRKLDGHSGGNWSTWPWRNTRSLRRALEMPLGVPDMPQIVR